VVLGKLRVKIPDSQETQAGQTKANAMKVAIYARYSTDLQDKTRIFRITCLDRWLFGSMTEVRVVIQQWLEEYNNIRPHGSLAGMNPEQFLQCWTEGRLNQQPKSLTA